PRHVISVRGLLESNHEIRGLTREGNGQGQERANEDQDYAGGEENRGERPPVRQRAPQPAIHRHQQERQQRSPEDRADERLDDLEERDAEEGGRGQREHTGVEAARGLCHRAGSSGPDDSAGSGRMGVIGSLCAIERRNQGRNDSRYSLLSTASGFWRRSRRVPRKPTATARAIAASTPPASGPTVQLHRISST